MFKLKKRGQITVFIIIGIVILMTTATYFYFKQRVTTFEPQVLPERKTTALHPYVEACLEMQVRDALGIIGATGGYIDYPPLINNDPASYLRLAPIDEAKMPYWWYAGENRILPLDDPENYYSINAQIERYVINNIDDCIDNFTAVPGYEIYKTGDVDVILTFAKNDIAVEMKYPLRAVKIPQMNEFSLTGYDFFVQIPIRFKEVYDIAKKILEDENEDNYMEHWTMDLISLADPKYTPLMNMDFRLNPYIWKFSKVTEELKDLITKNIQYIKFDGTKYNPHPENMPYMQNHYVWYFDTEYHENIRASLTFDSNWPFRIDIAPTKAGQLKSGSMNMGEVLSFIGIQLWHFTYDLVYPVVVTIKDEASRTSDEYVFSYSFLVSIQNNRPYRQNFGSTVFTSPDQPTTKEVCEYLIDSLDTEATVSTINEYTRNPLPKVNLTFTCGRYTCPIGRTKYISHGASASVITRFPYCVWGILRGYREGYEDAEKFITADGTNNNFELEMKPVIEYKNYTVVKHLYVPGNPPYSQIGNADELFEGEEAVVIITSSGADQFASYPSEHPLALKFYRDKKFSYNVTIYLFDDDEILGAYEGIMFPDPRTVENSNHIIFHVMEYPAKSEEEMGLFLAGIKSYSKRISGPEFIIK